MSNPFNIDTISAGADWVQWRRSRLKKSNYVKLYELTKIRTSYGSGELYLAIYDDERGMDRSLSEWHRDPLRDIGVLQLRNSPALHLRRRQSTQHRES